MTEQAAQIVGRDGDGQLTLRTLNRDQIELLKRTVCRDATDDELALFIHICNRAGLDPFARQIYAIKRRNKKTGRQEMTVQTGIDGYRLIADRTGKYAGSDDYTFDDGLTEFEHLATARGNPKTATARVYKLVDGERCAFVGTARWDEYFPGEQFGFLWLRMPYLMLGKCAEALTLRKAFPAELSGLYTSEEMQPADASPPGLPAPVESSGSDAPYEPRPTVKVLGPDGAVRFSARLRQLGRNYAQLLKKLRQYSPSTADLIVGKALEDIPQEALLGIRRVFDSWEVEAARDELDPALAAHGSSSGEICEDDIPF